MKFIFTPLFILISTLALATPPTTPSSNFHFNAIDGGFFNIGWTSGNGARRIIVAKAGSAPTFVPVNGIDYNSSDVFGQGQEVAPGEFIIFDHFSSSFFVTGLNPAIQYFFKIYEYNGSSATTEYLTASFASLNGFTSAPPTIQTSNATFSTITTNSITVNWSSGNGGRRLIVMKEGSQVNANPVSSTAYAWNAAFGTGAITGTGNYTVYAGSGANTTITNLQPGKQYFLAFYEFNGSQQPQYLTPAYTTNVTTRSIPTIASTNAVIAKTDGKELTLNWTNGNGQRRIIVAKQGSDITSAPVNGTDYNANANFGSGQTIGAGEFVVYDDNFNEATISGLNPSTTYFFKIFEYDGTGSTTMYLTSSFGFVSGPTATTPTTPTQILPSTNVTASSAQLNFTPGNGRARLVIGRKNAAVNALPVNFNAYNANSDFGSGQDLGNGNFVLFGSTESSVIIHNLDANSTYHFAVYEFNGFNQPLYLSPSVVSSVTTSGVLPVKLTSWEAVPQNGKVKLQWKTASEINASHFEIQRSSDGTNFTTIATVNAIGNNTTGHQYTTEDAAPLNGKSYYRLKMVDTDGSFEYSVIRTVILSNSAAVKILNNPVKDVLQVISSSKEEWQIISVSGQIVNRGILSSGRNEINVSNLANGTYWLRIKSNNEVQAAGFIKQ